MDDHFNSESSHSGSICYHEGSKKSLGKLLKQLRFEQKGALKII